MSVPPNETVSEKERRIADLFKKADERGVETALRNRKPNTTRAYKKAQELWAEFCARYEFPDGLYVNSSKLLLFTQEVVLKITVNRSQKTKTKRGKRKISKVVDEDADSSSSCDESTEA